MKNPAAKQFFPLQVRVRELGIREAERERGTRNRESGIWKRESWNLGQGERETWSLEKGKGNLEFGGRK